jgi:phospholipase D1/2
MAASKQKPAIALQVLAHAPAKAKFGIGVSLLGHVAGDRIELSFVEVNSDDGNGQADRVLGTAAGRIVPADGGKPRSYSFLPDQPAPAAPEAKVNIAFSFAKPGALDLTSPPGDAPLYIFALSDDLFDQNEGDFWEIQVRAENLGISSQTVPLARIRRQLEGQPCTYDWHDGHDIQLYHDGSTDDRGSDGAFSDLKKAIEEAKHFIFVVDWSFQPMHRLTRLAGADPKDTVGAQLVKAADKPNLLVAIHSWNHTYPFAQDTQNDDADKALDSIAKGMGRKEGRPPNLLWRATSREGTGLSHHQKFVVLDCEAGGRRDLKVFFGGLDLTKGRFDWPEHRLSTKDPTQVWPFLQQWNTLDNAFSVDDWYNAEFDGNRTLPRQPWHDIYLSAKGACAWDFVREFVGRWTHTPSIGGNTGDCSSKHVEAVWEKYCQLRDDRETFVQHYGGKRKGIWGIQVYRSLSSAHWAPPDREPKDDADKQAFESVTWSKKKKKVPKAENSIQLAYQQAIGQAEKFIYIENQYLIGSGQRWQGKKSTITNNIPERIVNKILERANAGKPFHVYIIKPMFPEGKPLDGSTLEIRKNEWMTAQYMVQTLAEKFGDKWTKYLSFYFLANWSSKTQPVNKGSRENRVRENNRYMVYVHSKFMIVDDRYFILGSANLNERSLNGDRDSEIACGVWPGHGHDGDTLKKIRDFRLGLWNAHFGPGVTLADTPEDPACASFVKSIGDQNYAAFRTLAQSPHGHACRWPYDLNDHGLLMIAPGKGYKVFDGPILLPDSPNDEKGWHWDCPGVWYIKELAE